MAEAENTYQQLDALSPAVRAFMKNAGTTSPDVFPVSAAMARRRLEGHGILIGTYTHIGIRDGNGLTQVFNVFAAPEDLTDREGCAALFTYDDAQARLSSLKNWHGFDGANYADDRSLFNALDTGAYGGGWFIPPAALLFGTDTAGIREHPANLCAHKDALGGTFEPAAFRGEDYPGWYWSSTKSPDDAGLIYAAAPSNGLKICLVKNSPRLNCRPVRLVPVKKGGPHG